MAHNNKIIMRPDLPEGVQTVHITGAELEALLAQAPPVVMVDRLDAVGPQYAESTYRIPADGVFTVENHLVEAGLIENIAQTVGAASGYRRQMAGRERMVGFLAAVKRLSVVGLPEVGTEIRTEVSFESSTLDFKIFQGRIRQGSEDIASCEMRIYTPDNQEESM